LNIMSRTPRILEDAPRKVVVETKTRRATTPARDAAEAIFRPKATAADHAVAAIAAASVPPSGTGDNDNSPYEYSHTEMMPTRQWLAIPDNPQQRDVKVRIAKGRATHLYRLDPAHKKVVVGLLPFGRMVKIEGHTRAFVWDNGMLHSGEVPESVVVEFWRCKDLQAAKDLYDKFDNPVTEENGSDRVNGAANDAGINFESAIMKDGEISTALRELWSYIFAKKVKRDEKQSVISKAFMLFKQELQLLDNVITSRKKFPQPVIMAAIITLRADPASIAFWKKYADGHAFKFEGERDAIAIFEDRLPDLLRKSNYVKQREIMGNAAAAVEAYRRGETYNGRGYQALNIEKLRAYAVKAFGGK
jgi:hypothetical protein